MKAVVPLVATAAAVGSCAGPTPAQRQDPIVVFKTNRGPIAMVIFQSVVPYTANNFLELVDGGFYNGLTFHRVETWCIQGGDPSGNGSGCALDPNTGQPRRLKLECHPRLQQITGAVAMARNQHPDSASCQFYILKKPMAQLNGKYAVFGKVVGNGMQTVNFIRPGDQIGSAYIERGEGVATTGSGAPAPTPKNMGPGLSIFNKPKETPTGDSGF
jgi:peptidyl-prolyl cis-trans isomerase B (cyclophilin B)